MLLAALFLLQASAAEPVRTEWLARPSARDIADCFAGAPKEPVVVALECRSAPKDKLEGCSAAATPADPRAEKAALCAAKTFRVRTTNTAGGSLVGVPITTQLRFGAP